MKINWFKLVCFLVCLVFTKVEFLNADSNFSVGTKISTPVFQAKFSFQDQKYNFGFAAFNDSICKQFPFSLKVGMISAGGSLSKLNNPTISAGTSPFSTGITETSGLNASLPGITSFSKPVSTFFQVGFINKKNPFTCNLSCFYSPEEKVSVFSEYISYKVLKNRLSFSNSVTVGLFPYSNNSSSSWTVNSPYYSEGEHLCSLLQFSLKYLNVISTFSMGIYETPFGKFEKTYRTDFKLPVNHFTFCFTGFYNPNNNLITSSDKNINDCFQIKTGILYKTILPYKKPLFLTYGINLYLNADTSGYENPFRINSGLQILSSLTSISLSGSAKFLIDTTNLSSPSLNVDELSFQLKNTWYIKKISPYFNFNATISPEQDFITSSKRITIKSGLNFTQFPKVSSYASYSFTHKNDLFSSKKITTGVTINTSLRYFTCTLKFSADINI